MKTALIGTWVSFLVALAGCAGTRPIELPEAAPLKPGEYVIGAADEIEVRVWRNEELTVRVQVRPDGSISVPLLDDVQAEGLTPTQLKELVAEELAEYITAPDVTVIVVRPNSKRAFVIGEVARSGPIPLFADIYITDAIAAAGGFGPFADKSDIKLIRRGDGDEIEYTFNYDAYVAGRAPATNIRVLPGDTIIIPD